MFKLFKEQKWPYLLSPTVEYVYLVPLFVVIRVLKRLKGSGSPAIPIYCRAKIAFSAKWIRSIKGRK